MPQPVSASAGAARPLLRAMVALVAAAGLVGLAATAAHGEAPARLDRQVTDTVGALAGAEDQVVDALADLQAAEGIELWVAYVATFDGLGGQEWANQTAELSGLGGNELLFAVAVQDRVSGYSADDQFPLEDAEIASIIAESVQPELADGDWAGAVTVLAEELSPGSGIWPWLLGGAALLAGALAALALALRRWPGSGAKAAASAPDEPVEVPLADLRRRSAAALVDVDDSLRTSADELAFATAQVGEQAAAPFGVALAQSRAELQRAFQLRRRAQAAAQELRNGGAPPSVTTPAAPAIPTSAGTGPDAGSEAESTRNAGPGVDVPRDSGTGPRTGSDAEGTRNAGTRPDEGTAADEGTGADAGRDADTAADADSDAGADPDAGTPPDADPTPDPEAAERALHEEILALCASADDLLDAEVELFDVMRDLEHTIDTVLPGLAEQVASLEERLPSTRAIAVEIQVQYARVDHGPFTRDLEQAEVRIDFARQSVERGTDLLAQGQRRGAIARARAAEGAIAQGRTLLDAVDRGPTILAAAERSLAALVAETEKDLVEAEALGLDGDLADVHRFASEALGWARRSIESGSYDPVAVQHALRGSGMALERALTPGREPVATLARAQALLPPALAAAEMAIQAADEHVGTRRGAVGAEARSRLAEAQRNLADGRGLADPVAALAKIQTADLLADEAHWLAQEDEDRYRTSRQPGRGGGGPWVELVLSGILIEPVRSGRGRGSGPSWRRPLGRHSGAAPGAGHRPGSFGGAETRGRRGGGGQF